MAGKRGNRSHANATSFGGKAGNPGNRTKPGPGRLPDTFKMRMATLAARAKTAKNVESILDDPKHPAFMKALEFATERGFGKVEQNVKAALTLDVVIRDEGARE